MLGCGLRPFSKTLVLGNLFILFTSDRVTTFIVSDCTFAEQHLKNRSRPLNYDKKGLLPS